MLKWYITTDFTSAHFVTRETLKITFWLLLPEATISTTPIIPIIKLNQLIINLINHIIHWTQTERLIGRTVRDVKQSVLKEQSVPKRIVVGVKFVQWARAHEHGSHAVGSRFSWLGPSQTAWRPHASPTGKYGVVSSSTSATRTSQIICDSPPNLNGCR